MASTKRHVFTSESVTEGHPDKVADQISDAVLDAILSRDANARVACETLVTTGMAVVAGEITTTTYVHIPDIVRSTIEAIGYTDASFGFDSRTCAVLTSIDRQSPDIARGVNSSKKKVQGAGDQGMMFGYATRTRPGSSCRSRSSSPTGSGRAAGGGAPKANKRPRSARVASPRWQVARSRWSTRATAQSGSGRW